MESNLALAAVRRSNRLMLIWGLVVVIIVAAGVYLDQRQLISLFSGPQPISTQDLARLKDADTLTNYWVTVSGSDIFDTGWQNYSEDDFGSKTVNYSYAALSVGKYYLLVEIPGEIDESTLPHSFTGALQNIPPDVDEQVIADIRSQNARIASLTLPVLLDTSDFRTGAYVRLALAVAGALLALALLYLSLSRSLNPYRHPIMKALARYGDPEQLSSAISMELMISHPQVGKSIHITPHWLVFSRGSSFQAAQLREVAWIYQSMTQHRTYGVNTRKTYAAKVWDQKGKPMTFAGKQDDVNAALQAIMQAAPWAVVGYKTELNKQWRKQRDQFLAGVNQRRREIERG